MRKRLLIIMGLALLLVLFLAVVFPKHTLLNPCPTFLSYIEAGDAKKSYALFSKTTRSSLSLDKWTKNVASMQQTFNKATPVGIQTNVPAPNLKNTNSVSVQYRIPGDGFDYIATCYLTPVGKGYQISSFNSYLQNGVAPVR